MFLTEQLVAEALRVLIRAFGRGSLARFAMSFPANLVRLEMQDKVTVRDGAFNTVDLSVASGSAWRWWWHCWKTNR